MVFLFLLLLSFLFIGSFFVCLFVLFKTKCCFIFFYKTKCCFVLLFGPCQAERCLRTCAKCTNSESSCTYAKSHPGTCFPLIHSIVSTDSVGGQQRPCSAQSDLGLRCKRMRRRHIFAWWRLILSNKTLKRCLGRALFCDWDLSCIYQATIMCT